MWAKKTVSGGSLNVKKITRLPRPSGQKPSIGPENRACKTSTDLLTWIMKILTAFLWKAATARRYCSAGTPPPYYLEFVERYGFTPGRGQNLAFALEVKDTPAIQRMERIAERARRQGRVTIRTANMQNWDREVENVLELLNASLTHLDGHIPWQPEQLSAMLEPFKDLADPELVLFAEVEGRVVGFFPGVSNLNEALIHANGLRYPWNYAAAWWLMRKQTKCLSIKSVLVLPEYWGSAVAVLLFAEMFRRVKARGYEWIDLSLTSDDNPKTPQLAERLGAKVYKRYQVYNYPVMQNVRM